ncbi:MAG: hypothetical protein ACFFD2_09905 [Promethearchaeota archaeon]
MCSKILRRWDAKGILCPDCRTPGGSIGLAIGKPAAPAGRKSTCIKMQLRM